MNKEVNRFFLKNEAIKKLSKLKGEKLVGDQRSQKCCYSL